MLYNRPYGITDPNAPYINGNPATGIQGSIPPAESIEYPQREIVAVIQYAADHGLLDYNSALCQNPSNADLQQLLKAIFGLSNRARVVVPFTFYVNGASGNDANDGLTALKALQTPQKAVDLAAQYAPGPNAITIKLADYPSYGGIVTPGYSIPVISFVGNTANPGNVVLDGGTRPAIWANAYNSVVVTGVTLKATGGYHYGPGSTGLCAYTYGSINVQQGVQFGRCDLAPIAAFGGTIACFYGITILPQTCDAVLVGGGGHIGIGDVGTNLHVTITGAVYCSAFATAQGGAGNVGSTGVSWDGGSNVHGPKFSGSYNGTFATQGMGVNYFPGDQAGILTTGAQYQ